MNRTAVLYTPRTVARSESRVMSAEQVERVLAAVEFREKVILQLSVFADMRPGELLAIQRNGRRSAWDRCFAPRMDQDGCRARP